MRSLRPMACVALRPSRYPALEHRLVGRVTLRLPNDLDASARGEAETTQHVGIDALARYPRVRQCREKVNVAPRLTLDPVDERRAMIVDEMGKGTTAERWEVRAWQQADKVTRQIERLRRRQCADDLAKSSPGQVGVCCRLAEVTRVPFRESNELNR